MTTQELTKEMIAMKTHVAGLDEVIKDNCARLVEMEREVKEQGKLLQSIDRLVMGLARLDEKITDLSGKIDDFGGRIKLIELKPAQKWEAVMLEVVKYIVIAGLGFGVAKLLGVN